MRKLLLDIETKKILPDSTCIDRIVYVEGGTFWMGDNESEYATEKPAHQVKLDSFYIGQYPVTQKFWEAVMGDNPSNFKGNRRPVETVSWEDTQEFFEKLNKMPGIQYTYRLPTEAEWEFAARGGNKSLGYEYAGSDFLDEVGWYNKNSDNESKEAGLKLPNELGLYDMSGNVWEWCQDYYSGSYYQKCFDEGAIMNPKGPNDGEILVVRGGSWYYAYPDYCRVFARDGYRPDLRSVILGFRCARY